MQKKDIKPERKLVRRGENVEVVTNIPTQKLSSMDVLFNITQLQKEIVNAEQQINQMEENITRMNQAVKNNKEMMAKFQKHANWARQVQESIFKSVVEQVEQECYEKVEKTYNYDEALTEEQNNVQKYHQLRQFIATHSKMSEKVVPEVAQTKLFEENVVKNPWRNK